MTRKLYIVVLLALMTGGFTAPAMADEASAKKAEKTRKVLAALSALGIDDPELKAFITSIDSNTKDGFLRLSEYKTETGKVTLQYATGNGLKLKQLELKYAPDDSNWQATARADQVMIKYKYSF